MSTHTINKISLILPAPDYNQAQEYQANAKHWASHTLPVLLNEYFETINKNDDIIYLEKIEINLIDLPWKISDVVWMQKMQSLIKTGASATELFPIIFRQWLFYLRNGCFENTAILKTIRDSENYVFSNWKNLNQQLINEVRNLNISTAFLNRLFSQHSKEIIVLYIKRLFDINHDEAEKVILLLQAESKQNPDIVQKIIPEIIELINQGKISEKQNAIGQLINEKIFASKQDMVAKTRSKSEFLNLDKKTVSDDIFITCTNAGLVLLFPYLKLFFENNFLIEKDKFINEAAKIIAVQALYFLATGQDSGDEDEYIIPKLLCGIEPNEYVEFENGLNSLIKVEADELLQAVIDHWKILQNTSVSGLRETFLQRNGKLIKKGGQYTLQVAESGVDILLNNIPWGFRNYKLPWMPFTIITEWY